jgi:hypothetical protein
MCRVLLSALNSSNETQVIALSVMVVQPTDDLEMLHCAVSQSYLSNGTVIIGTVKSDIHVCC